MTNSYFDYYDYFGKTLTKQQADEIVRKKGLTPNPSSYVRVGVVHVTKQLLDAGEDLFFNRELGNSFLGQLFGDSAGLEAEFTKAFQDLGGKATTNLQITL